MNIDQVTGKVKEIAGAVQAGTGKFLGNLRQEFKGRRLQTEGKAQGTLGNANALVSNAHRTA
jgi:uncharacterized protein YjbJ (UPF0337 family)